MGQVAEQPSAVSMWQLGGDSEVRDGQYPLEAECESLQHPKHGQLNTKKENLFPL